MRTPRSHPVVTAVAVAAFLAIVVTATATPAPGTGRLPEAASLEGFRATVRGMVDAPAAWRVRLTEGQFRSRGVRYAFDLGAETTTGGVTLTLALRRPEGTDALTVQGHATGGPDDSVRLDVDVAGPPAVLGRFWPEALPMPAAVATRSRITVARGGDVTAGGRLSVGAAAATPLVVDYTSRYEARRGRLEASVTGAEAQERVQGTFVYAAATGVFDGELTLAPLDARSVASRLGLSTPVPALVASDLRARLSGVLRDTGVTARAEVGAHRVQSAWLAAPVDARFSGAATLTRGAEGFALGSLERAALTLGPERQPLAVVTAASLRESAWPVRLEGRSDDLGRLAPLLPSGAALAGTARLTGQVRAEGRLALSGRLEAEIEHARLPVGRPLTLSNAKATIPLRVGGAEDEETGTVFVERLEVFDVVVDRLLSSARFVDGRLLLPDIGYVHYGGRGWGWLEAATDGRAVPVRTRLAAERIDLSDVVRGFGSSVGHATGLVHYVATAQYATASGLAALVQVYSQDDGGEVSIDALERMLKSQAVQVESTGLLQRTLQNLRVFEYSSLAGTLLYEHGAGHIDLSLTGKKRFGIFPAPVEAINIRNMPLSVLAGALQGGTSK